MNKNIWSGEKNDWGKWNDQCCKGKKKKQIIKTTRLKETKRNILTLIFKVLMIYHSLRIHNIKQYLPKY